jgi:hypothetical protein
MVKRVLNQRFSFTLNSTDKVSSNYFPIVSAISIVDQTNQTQLIVLNDRTQGGSALSKGRIELMQNRRLFADDDKGVEEVLNETDPDGNGLRVNANYYLSVFGGRSQGQKSPQREQQLKIDEPLQYFFSFNPLSTKANTFITGISSYSLPD